MISSIAGCTARVVVVFVAFWMAPLAAGGPSQDEATRALLERAAAVTPHPRQLAWQEREFLCFIHFGINTFTGREWGTGFEDPALFFPEEFDAEQWVESAKSAGMKGFVLTTKHHDGFCLWQTRYTTHGVASSPWRNGKGDVVRDLAAACAKHGMSLGVYLSPADLYQIENPDGLYGNGSSYSRRPIPRPVPGRPFPADAPRFEYEVDDYNEYFLNQLYELLTEYGPIHEVWFDGAHPKRKGGQTYVYDEWYELIRTLAPDAVIAIKGPDVRWCGNEAGHTRPAEWSVIPLGGTPDEWDWPDLMAQDLGSVEKLREGSFLHWYPAETNTSLRHGWFWRDEDQVVKSAREILDIWYRSVGGNTVFLLNLTPDRRGLIPDRDRAVLREVGDTLRGTFAKNLVQGGTARASNMRVDFAAALAVDGDPQTCWMPGDWSGPVELAVWLPEARRFNRIVLQEQIRDHGQRIASFAVDVVVEGEVREVATGTTVGYKRICRFGTVESGLIRVRILDARVCPTLAEIGLYLEVEPMRAPEIRRDREGNVTFLGRGSTAAIRYTLDGTEPTAASPLFRDPIPLPRSGEVRARGFDLDGAPGPVAQSAFDVAKLRWRVVACDSEEPLHGNEAAKAIDDDPSTIWHTAWATANPPHPHFIAIDLGEELELAGFTYLPRAEGLNGTIKTYAVHVSEDGEQWGEPVVVGEFANIANNPIEQRVAFERPMTARFLRLEARSSAKDDPWTSAAEIGIITKR